MRRFFKQEKRSIYRMLLSGASRGSATAAAAAAVVILSGIQQQASAASYSWTNAQILAWSAGSWNGSSPPSSNLDNQITFNISQNSTGTLDTSQLQLNKLTMAASGSKSLKIDASGGGSLNFVSNTASALPTFSINKTTSGSLVITAPITVTNALTVTNSGTVSGAAIQGSIANAAGITFDGSGTGSLTLGTSNGAGVISGAGGITQSGSYTLTTTGANTYQGATLISGGIFNVSGTLGKINSTSGITINGGELSYNSSVGLTQGITFTKGTLSGTTTVTGVAATNNNDTVAPGSSSAASSFGVLTVNGGFSLKDAASNGASAGGKLAIEVSKAAAGGSVGAAGGTYDQVAVSSASPIDLTNGVLALSTGSNVEVGDVYYILNNQIASNGLAGTFGSATINGVAATASTAVIGGLTYQSFTAGQVRSVLSYNAVAGTSFGGSGNDVALEVIPVPEPACLAFVGLGIGGVLVRRRQK